MEPPVTQNINYHDVNRSSAIHHTDDWLTTFPSFG